MIGRLVLVLTSVSIISGILLALIESSTKDEITGQEKSIKLDKVTLVLPNHDNDPYEDKRDVEGVDFYIGKKDDMVVGVAFETEEKEGYGGPISIMLGVSLKGEITGIEVISHKETPGLGKKIEDPEFRRQFIGKSLSKSKINVKKDKGEIDAITGATISSRAVCKAVSKGLILFERVKGQLIDPRG